MSRKHYFHGLNRRLSRIERKCDRILHELSIRQRDSDGDELTCVIDRLHHAARRMKEQCERELLLANTFNGELTP